MQIVQTLMGAKESAGSSLGISEMPGYLADALKMAHREMRVQEAAQDEAVNNV